MDLQFFLLYDRQSKNERDLVPRLDSALQQQGIATSPFYDGTNEFVLKAYEDKLQAADKVVTILSPDFLYSEESIYIFEMARNLCMDEGQNNIIVCSRSWRNLPPAFNSFLRVLMTDKGWIDSLVEEIKAPGEMRVNVKDVLLYKECDRNSSVSMPHLSCLKHPPTQPKHMADSFMVWSRLLKLSYCKQGLYRRTSERLQRQSHDSGTSPVRKAASFNKDRETEEFVSRTCIRNGIPERKEKADSQVSTVDRKDKSSLEPRLKKKQHPIPSFLPEKDPENHSTCKKLTCSVPKRKSPLQRYWKTRRRSNVTKAASTAKAMSRESNTRFVGIKPFVKLNEAYKFPEVFAWNFAAHSKTIFTNRQLPKDTIMPRYEIPRFFCLGSVLDVTFCDPKKVHLSDQTVFKPVSINSEQKRLNSHSKHRRHLGRSSIEQALTVHEKEFDLALKSQPEQFRKYCQLRSGSGRFCSFT